MTCRCIHKWSREQRRSWARVGKSVRSVVADQSEAFTGNTCIENPKSCMDGGCSWLADDLSQQRILSKRGRVSQTDARSKVSVLCWRKCARNPRIAGEDNSHWSGRKDNRLLAGHKSHAVVVLFPPRF